MGDKIFYKESVEKDLASLGHAQARQVIEKFEKRIGAGDKGEVLKGRFHGLQKLRLGDYRVIFTHLQEGVLVLRIAHRKEVYK